MHSIVERVILLQGVDVFEGVATEQLSYVASVANEVTRGAGSVLFRAGEPPEAMYVVIEGEVRLTRGEQVVTVAGPGDAFGTWSLLDDEPQVVDATATTEVTLLRVDRVDFVDLLADNVELTRAVLKGIVQRLRAVAGRLTTERG